MALNCTLASNILEIIDQKHDNGAQLYNEDEKLIICQKIINIMETIFDDGKYYYHSQYVKLTHIEMLKIYAERKDAENALTQLENAAKYAVMFDTYDQKVNHTSLLFTGMESGGYFKDSPNENHSLWLLQTVTNPRYDFIRENPRFVAIEILLKHTK